MSTQDIYGSFIQCLESIPPPEGKELFSLLKKMDARSSVSFNHSVLVAVFLMERLQSSNLYTEDEITRWVEGALIHDAGKMIIPLYILHGGALSTMTDSEKSIMMMHSFMGKDIIENTCLPKECMASALCHHLKYECMENRFKKAEEGRPEWKNFFNKGELTNFLKETVGWVLDDKKAIFAIENLTYCDILEAMKNKSRSYKGGGHWLGPFNICSVINEGVCSGQLKEEITADTFKTEYWNFVELTARSDMDNYVRAFIKDNYDDKDVYVQSEDKVADILQDKEKGRLFMEKTSDGMWSVTIPEKLESSEKSLKSDKPIYNYLPSDYKRIIFDGKKGIPLIA